MGLEIRYGKRVRSRRNLRNLALVGFMGTGKSSVGRLAARSLRYEFVDTDRLIETEAGMKITEIFAQKGEAHFRKLEREVVEALESRSRLVIATGGGLVAQPGNLESLRRHALVICLWASPEVIYRRVGAQANRPLLQTRDPQSTIRSLLEQRRPHYRMADVLLSTDLRSVRSVASQVVHQFRLAQPKP